MLAQIEEDFSRRRTTRRAKDQLAEASEPNVCLEPIDYRALQRGAAACRSVRFYFLHLRSQVFELLPGIS